MSYWYSYNQIIKLIYEEGDMKYLFNKVVVHVPLSCDAFGLHGRTTQLILHHV